MTLLNILESLHFVKRINTFSSFAVRYIVITMSLCCSDLERVREGLGSKCSFVIQYMSTFVAGITVGFITSWKLTLVVMVVGPFFIGATGYLVRVCYERSCYTSNKVSGAWFLFCMFWKSYNCEDGVKVQGYFIQIDCKQNTSFFKEKSTDIK
jgi:ABC-type multidrug transport system fused ATPase/permease subunit